MDTDYTSSGGEKEKSHKLLWIILGVILILIIGVMIAYFIDKNHKSSTTTTSSTTSQSSTSATKTFAPAVNSNQPYAATITTSANGTKKSATMVSDGQGNYSYTYKTNGQTASVFYTPTAYYLCMNASKCIKYATTDTSSSGFDPSTYQYDSTKLENLKNTAAYKGQQECPGGVGTCDVWSATNGSTTTTFYVDFSSKRILKATSTSGTTTTDITYAYKSVHIAIPTSYTTAPSKQ